MNNLKYGFIDKDINKGSQQTQYRIWVSQEDIKNFSDTVKITHTVQPI